MIHSVFDLGDTIVKEVMIPRTEMVWIEAGKTLRQGLCLALRSGSSRIPVSGADGDDVRGIHFFKEVIRRTHGEPKADATERVESLMRLPTFCPDGKPVDELLRQMQLSHSHVAIISDEFDSEIAPFVELGQGRFRVSSRLPIDEVGKLFSKRLDDDDVDTVFGLMVRQLDSVPIPGSSIMWEGLEFVAEHASGRRHSIQTVVVGRTPESEEIDGASDNGRHGKETDDE